MLSDISYTRLLQCPQGMNQSLKSALQNRKIVLHFLLTTIRRNLMSRSSFTADHKYISISNCEQIRLNKCSHKKWRQLNLSKFWKLFSWKYYEIFLGTIWTIVKLLFDNTSYQHSFLVQSTASPSTIKKYPN